jgi:phospholipid-translocating P-type ATPase (flippase)
MKSAEDAGDRKRQQLLGNFWLCHAVCHTISVQQEDGDSSKKPGAPVAYSASSPDELALVWAAHDIGLSFRGQMDKTINLQVMEPSLAASLAAVCGAWSSRECPLDLQVELLDLCEFDNDRKRMSVVVGLPDGRKVMLMKGADSAVLPYLPVAERDEAGAQLQQFACIGLRTLVLASRELSSSEHASWSSSYKAAQAEISDDREARVKELVGTLETAPGLSLLGVTAIEDRLQDGVPDTLQFVRQAGITVWVLTGDKLETAICIGKACRLLTDAMENVEISGETSEVVEALTKFEGQTIRPEERAITITGSALAAVLEDEGLKVRFYRMAKDCKTVICCRVSPKQKADVVEMVKALHQQESDEQPITLAIGDGANDVSMITSAHVGVGLSGKEGAQAARAADFAIGHFRFLRRLIFVHGRESYRRNSVVVNYNFYKNMVLVMPAAFYGPSMAYSGQPFYEQIMYQLYNVFFTFWPGVFYAILDRPVIDLSVLEGNEELYKPALGKQFFSRKVFVYWLAAGILQGGLIEFAAFYVFGGQGTPDDGPNPDSLWLSGTGAYFWVVLGVNLTLYQRLALRIDFNVFVIVFSVACFPVTVFLLDKVAHNVFLHGISSLLFGPAGWRYWLATCIVVCVFLGLGEPLIRKVTFGLLPSEIHLRSKDEYSLMKTHV